MPCTSTTVKSQSRLGTLVEQVCNVGSGLLIAMLTWVWVMPHWFSAWSYVFGEVRLEYDAHSAVASATLFTIISLVRGYLWRRAFNHLQSRGWFTK